MFNANGRLGLKNYLRACSYESAYPGYTRLSKTHVPLLFYMKKLVDEISPIIELGGIAARNRASPVNWDE